MFRVWVFQKSLLSNHYILFFDLLSVSACKRVYPKKNVYTCMCVFVFMRAVACDSLCVRVHVDMYVYHAYEYG